MNETGIEVDGAAGLISSAPLAVRRCAGCGCTEDDSCRDRTTGRACYWLFPDVDLCSACGGVIVRTYSGIDDAVVMMIGSRLGWPRIEDEAPLVILVENV
jgi:hypothetical protein